MSSDPRPLSPHLQVYKPQITSMTSFAHRATGFVLALGFIDLVIFLAAAAGGPESFATAMAFFGSVAGQLILLALVFSFVYHLCNGIRHLLWDAGIGLELETARASGWAVLAASVVLTALIYALAMGLPGGGA